MQALGNFISGAFVAPSGTAVVSRNPAADGAVVFETGMSLAAAGDAVRAAAAAQPAWGRLPLAERAGALERFKQAISARADALADAIVLETGKLRSEARAEIQTLINRFDLARSAVAAEATGRQVGPGEQLRYQPLGVVGVIGPFNFPLHLCHAHVIPALLTGNTVVVKPSSDSPAIAAKFVELCYEAGVPKGVINFVTGPGSSVGDTLVMHPKTRFIAFTGSKEVGLNIGEQAAKKQPGQIWIKRTVLEMGGKDAIIVDDEADLDAAVDGVTASAFGYQGQKCSACSRAIVTEKVYTNFLAKLKERVAKIKVGASEDPHNYMGPVINKSSMQQILDYIEVGKKEGRLIIGGARADGEGYFIQPTVIADVKPKARIAQEEIFGPVLAVIPAKDFDDALAIANDTEFGLTGGVYSKNPKKLEKAAEQFFVGNSDAFIVA